MSPPPDLQARLTQLREYVRRLEFWLDQPAQGIWSECREMTLERLVQIVVECAADAGDQWLVSHGRPLGASAAGVFGCLRDAGVIDQACCDRFRD